MIKVYFKANAAIARIAAAVLKADNCAIVFGQTIYLHHITITEIKNNPTLLSHELTHVLQWKKYGRLVFPLLYFWYTVRFGYYRNPLEAEARANESDRLLPEKFILE